MIIMFKIYNPLDISADIENTNPILQGISYNIRNSTMIKIEALEYMHTYFIQFTAGSDLDVLEYILNILGYRLEELTIADEHELLDEIHRIRMS